MDISVFPKDIPITLFEKTYYIKETYIGSLVLCAFVILLALIFRFLILPRFTLETRKMKTTQMLCEYVLGALDKFTAGTVGRLGEELSPYILGVAGYIIGSGILELFGMRSPLTDLSVTLAFGLTTFVLINFYGLREKRLVGRLKHYVKPAWYVAPFKLISDLSTPISLSCRLFGNMLVGYIVMDLVYGLFSNLIKSFAVWVLPEVVGAVLPGILSLYFVLFHTAIQLYVFSTLSLTFINEATE